MSRPVDMHLFHDYRPHEAQVAFHRSGRRFEAICAGRRGGKTYGAGREFLRRVFDDLARLVRTGWTWEEPEVLDSETKALTYWCVAPTYVLGSYQRQEIFEILGGVDSPLVLRYQRNAGRLWLAGGIRIEFKSASDPNKLVGSGLRGVWLDEAARAKRDTWSENLRGALADHQGWAIFSSTPMGRNWYYDEVWSKSELGEGEPDPAYGAHHFRTIDNTAVPGLVEEVEQARKDMSDAVFRRNFLADWDAFEGKVFEDFLDSPRYVYTDADVPAGRKFVRVLGGQDWGFGSPGCYLAGGVDFDGVYWIEHEIYAAGLTVSAPERGMDCWIERMRALPLDPTVIHADPAGAEHITTCRRHRLPTRAANNSVQDGIDAIAKLLKVTSAGTTRLRIHRRCVNLRRQLAAYMWSPSSPDRPVKDDDHSVDALRYMILGDMLRHDESLKGPRRRRRKTVVR